MLGLHFKTDCHDGGRVCWQVQGGRRRIKACAQKDKAEKDDRKKDKAVLYTGTYKHKQTEKGTLRAALAEPTAKQEGGRVLKDYHRTQHQSQHVHATSKKKECVREEENLSPDVPDVCLRARAASICCPASFFCDAFAQKIAANRAHANQQWIFDLIRGEYAPNEFVFVDEPQWMLVQGNSHVSHEMRYLVVFKDKTLHTIRDLRQKHIPLLRSVREKVSVFLRARHAHYAAFRYYFHYMPSVFQLHLHVCSNDTADMNRTQPLPCVIRNIETNDTWYRDALIFFSAARATRAGASAPYSASHIYAARSARLCANRAADKHDGLCI